MISSLLTAKTYHSLSVDFNCGTPVKKCLYFGTFSFIRSFVSIYIENNFFYLIITRKSKQSVSRVKKTKTWKTFFKKFNFKLVFIFPIHTIRCSSYLLNIRTNSKLRIEFQMKTIDANSGNFLRK